MAESAYTETENYSIALIGSSGGGTATLGHTHTDELLTTIHRELLRVREDDYLAGAATNSRKRRVCNGVSHAIFISTCDGGGFDSIRQDDWRADPDGARGPTVALFTVGFKQSNENEDCQPPLDHFQVHQIAKGPLSKINAMIKKLDGELSASMKLHNSTIRAVVSISSEPSLFHET